jgi:murein tripeptide amidase MpaA
MNHRLLLLAGTLTPFIVLALTPDELLPPALPWKGASEALIVAADHPWITPTERSGMIDTPDYAETVAWLEKLAVASPRVETISFGRSAQGRDLCAVIASREGLDTAAKLATSAKPTLLVQGGIHSGEIDGKDAGMMLLRDIAFGEKGTLLDKANLLFIPVLNADGHEHRSIWNRPNQRGPVHQGWRTTAQNLNLNRDYMKAQAPEMIAVLKLIQDAKPALYLDIHVTDGVDYQYDITFGYHGWQGGFAWSPTIGQWLDRTLRPALDADLTKAGHIPGPLVFAKNKRDLSEGIIAKPFDPRFSNGYGDLRHLPTMLIENHSLKPFRQRVLGTYVLIESCLRIIGEEAAALQHAIVADQSSRPEKLGLNWNGASDHETTMSFLGAASETYASKASGGDEVRWQGTPHLYEKLPLHLVKTPKLTVRRPRAYYIPITEADMLAVLQSHGIQMEPLKEAQSLNIEHYRLVNPTASAKPFEGRHTLVTSVKAESGSHTFPAGTMKVSTDQPLGDLAIALLEPEHLDSLAAWGFVPEILSRTEYIEGYVIAPLAERMMQEDPKLKAEFEAKVATDPNFAKDPEARLEWFYQRSPFHDQAYLRYPVAIER